MGKGCSFGPPVALPAVSTYATAMFVVPRSIPTRKRGIGPTCNLAGTMAQTILGLDIGGANLKAATADKRAVSVPFPLWKQPDKLPAALAELVAKFPEAEELAVTMTGELCDC